MSKKWYSTCWKNEHEILNKYINLYKSKGLQVPDDISETLIRDLINYGVEESSNGTLDDLKCYYTAYQLEIQKKIPNIFFEEKELKDFLFNTKITSLDGLKEYVKNNGEKLENDCLDLDNNGNITYKKSVTDDNYCLVYNLRIPYEKLGYTVLFYLQGEDLFVWVYHEESFYYTGFSEQYTFDDFNKREDDVKKYVYFALNFLFYIVAFPESLVDEFPEIKTLKLSDVKDRINLKIKTNKEIVETEHASRTIHFRKGHFRYLKSDYFKNKKNTWIFVHSAIVGKGTAKVLLDKDDKESKFI